jgi:hypothetical protein
MQNALYYTFSTIAQALAAAMALLAAFAMYRLKGIDEESAGAASVIESITGGGVALRQHYLLGHWKKCMKAADERIEIAPLREVLTLRTQLLQLRLAARGTRMALWGALGATAVVMAGSVAALAYVPEICGTGFARPVLTAGVFGFGVCLAAYTWLVWQSFRVSKE